MDNQDVFALVDELQGEIEMAPTKGFSKQKALDANILLEIVEDIKEALHREFDTSRKVLLEKDAMLSSAQAQADAIVKEARERAAEMVADDVITKTAQDQAARMIEKAKQQSRDIKRNAERYAYEVFDELEAFYNDSLDLLSENREKLQSFSNGGKAEKAG